jgi:hypothetical protein
VAPLTPLGLLPFVSFLFPGLLFSPFCDSFGLLFFLAGGGGLGARCGTFFFALVFLGQSRFYSPFTPLRRVDTFCLASRFFCWLFVSLGSRITPARFGPHFFWLDLATSSLPVPFPPSSCVSP